MSASHTVAVPFLKKVLIISAEAEYLGVTTQGLYVINQEDYFYIGFMFRDKKVYIRNGKRGLKKNNWEIN